ncbi:hypothetical protein TURU_013324 [Turdus rufiventris]|nr:hypothetical protein TURU_013324 [Turdus rufiventris]
MPASAGGRLGAVTSSLGSLFQHLNIVWGCVLQETTSIYLEMDLMSDCHGRVVSLQQPEMEAVFSPCLPAQMKGKNMERNKPSINQHSTAKGCMKTRGVPSDILSKTC